MQPPDLSRCTAAWERASQPYQGKSVQFQWSCHAVATRPGEWLGIKDTDNVNGVVLATSCKLTKAFQWVFSLNNNEATASTTQDKTPAANPLWILMQCRRHFKMYLMQKKLAFSVERNCSYVARQTSHSNLRSGRRLGQRGPGGVMLTFCLDFMSMEKKWFNCSALQFCEKETK